MERGTREQAKELRAIAPLVVLGPKPLLVGPCTLVTNGKQTIAFSSAELLRKAGEPLAIALTLDCSKTIQVKAWSMGRVPHMGMIGDMLKPQPDLPRGAALPPARTPEGTTAARFGSAAMSAARRR